MSKRTERREAERVARKLAYQELRQQPAQQTHPVLVEATLPQTEEPKIIEDLLARAQAFFTPEAETPIPAVSEAQLAANRVNSQLSSGPKTSAGKAVASMNALKHGLTGQTVVLMGEDAVEYNRNFDSYIDTFKPVGEQELRLVQALLDSNWRINRSLRMESAIFIKGYAEFEGKFEDRPPAQRQGLILAEVYLKYEKSLRNLHVQEARLRRCREKDQAELARLQTIRRREELIATEALQANSRPPQSPQPSHRPTTDGFVFSTSQTPLRKPSSKGV